MAKTDLKQWKQDPEGFLWENYGVKVWQKQREILESVRDFVRTSVRSCNAGGKSFVAAGLMMWFLYCHYPSIVLTTAPTYRQVRDIIWREAATMYGRSKIAGGGDFFLPTTRFNLAPNWYALGLSSDQPDKFQGYHQDNVLIIVDEPSGVDEYIFEGIEGIMAGGNARLLLIGNPMSMVGTYRDSHMDEKKSQLYNQIHISALESPNVKAGKTVIPGLCTKEWIEERKEEWGEDNPLYQIRVLGEFPQQGIDTLIALNWITQAIERDCKPDGPKVLGVDIARYGDDESVASLRQGNKLLEIWRWAKQDTMQTTNRVVNICRTNGIESPRIDVIGIGAGVVDRLKELKLKPVGVNVSEKSSSEKYANLRAEIFWQLRERFQKGDIDIKNDSKTVAQLAGLKYEFDSYGRLKLQSKEDMRKKGMKSPDIADSLALAFMENTKRKLAFTWA